MNAAVLFNLEPDLPVQEFMAVMASSGLGERRPMEDVPRMDRMLREADLIFTARSQATGELVGVARALTDFSYCTYLADLAVAAGWQGRGIGRLLIRQIHEAAGLHTNLILIAAPGARSYYPYIGMAAHDSCWITRGDSLSPLP